MVAKLDVLDDRDQVTGIILIAQDEELGMNRREYLKNSAMLLAGSAILGCDAEDSDATSSSKNGPRSSHEREMHEQGTVPIDRSAWTAPEGVLPSHPSLEEDLDADVVIVGAGLAGSSLALHLAEAGVGVVLLEARQPGWGASGRNAGHVLPWLKSLSLYKNFPNGGKEFLELFRQHVSIPFDLARKHGIGCDAVQAGYLNAMESKRSFEEFKEKSRYWTEEQGQEVEFLGGSDMKSLTGSDYYPYGVLYKAGGRVNPYLLTNGMVFAAKQRGAFVFGGSEVVALTESGKRWRVDSAKGSVTSDRVVFCTNAYPRKIIPEFTSSFYPLTSYALSTKPLPKEAREIIMPGRAAMAQVPLDLNPFIVDGNHRIITALIPSVCKPENGKWHFKHHLAWIHRTWPETREMDIELEKYWTGIVAFRDLEFPGVFEVRPGVFGLMHFNAWGNLMAPLLGMILADGLAKDKMDRLPFSLETPEAVGYRNKQELIIRRLLIPAARLGQRLGIV